MTVVALLAATGIAVLVSGLPPLRRRPLAHRIEPYLSGLHGRASILLRRPQRLGERGIVGRLVRGLVALAPESHERLSERLAIAGHARDAGSFRLEQVVWGLTATVALWSVTALLALSRAVVDPIAIVVLSAIALASGFLARDWWLGREIERRRSKMQEQLPMALDLITLSIMSGESVPAAFARVAAALGAGIGLELGRVVGDIRAGSNVVDALEAMKDRAPVAGVGRLVDALVTGIERGAPLADVLRAQADDAREARRRSLLEMGGRREVLMLVPVVFLIMPVVVAFTLLPGLVALDLLVP